MYFLSELGKHDVTLASFSSDLSELDNFISVRMGPMDVREGTDNLVMIRPYVREISTEKREGGGIKYPLSVAG